MPRALELNQYLFIYKMLGDLRREMVWVVKLIAYYNYLKQKNIKLYEYHHLPKLKLIQRIEKDKHWEKRYYKLKYS